GLVSMKRTRIAYCVILPLALSAAPAALAQNTTGGIPFNIGDAVRQSDEARRPPLPRNAAPLVLPRLVEPQLTLQDHETLLVRSFRAETPEGIVDPAQFHEILEPYENRRLTLAQIYEAADRITTLYRDKGYMVAKAYVPAQDARRGVLRIKVVLG